MSVNIPVVSTPGVLGGKPRIEGTRIGVHLVGSYIREHGWSRSQIAEAFDLSDAEIAAALDYYDTHPEEMAAIRDQKDDHAARLREQSRAPE